jgi:hypothetical protein
MDEEARQQEVVADLPPDLGFIGVNPVGLAIGLERGDRLAHPHCSKGEAVDPAKRWQSFRPALVEPDDRGPERTSVIVGDNDRPALAGQGDARNRLGPDHAAGPERRAGLADRSPVELGVLLRPAGLGRDVRFDRDAGARDETAARIEDECPDALRAGVKRKDVLGDGRRRTHPAAPLSDGVRGERRGS